MKVFIDLKKEEDKSYNIYIEPLDEIKINSKVAIITNPTVAKYHLKSALNAIKALQVEVIEVPDGEEYKNLKTVESILNRLFELKFDRKSTLVALGGGVIGDMTGFAASIYQRGINFIQMPTTLLSQVDASVGGKTGVNNSFGKNLIGSFYQPKAVYIDPKFLDTLPKREFSAGLAEVIKMAVMFDGEFFEFLENNDLFNKENRVKLIAKSVELKANVVKLDEKEKGLRAVLNYGHTFGHVIENLTDYKKYLHGEAVAIGMVMANRLAVKLNLLTKEEEQRIKSVLEKYNLPTTFKIEDENSFYEHFFLDKKSLNNKIAFILPNGKIGTNVIKNDIDKNIVLDVLKEFKG